MHCDLAAFMKIAPLSVQSQCAAWRALGYFRSVGLRHLPVVDETNIVGLYKNNAIP
jgi:predicted transcriptional regulator